MSRRLLSRSIAEQMICLLGLVASAVVLWTYADLLAALMSSLNDGPASVFGVLHSGLRTDKGNFRASLLLVMFGMLASLALTRRLPQDDSSVIARAGVLALTALIGLLMACSWRVLYAKEYKEVLYDSSLCFVLGEDQRTWLLHCPGVPPPRNRVVGVDDSRMTVTGRVGSPFDAYPPVAGYVPDARTSP